MKHYCSHLFWFVFVIGGACLAQSDNVSLGDLARKNQTHGKSVMVFDDENTRRTSASNDTASTSASSKTTITRPAAGPETAKAEAKNSAAGPGGGQVDKLKKQLDSLKQQQSVWSKSAKEYEEKLVNETSDFRRQVYEEALDNDKQNVQLYQQKIDQVQTELNKAQESSHTPDHADGSSGGGHGNQP
jgi:hypothetical protein